MITAKEYKAKVNKWRDSAALVEEFIAKINEGLESEYNKWGQPNYPIVFGKEVAEQYCELDTDEQLEVNNILRENGWRLILHQVSQGNSVYIQEIRISYNV